MPENVVNGSCLCGAVTFEARTEIKKYLYCFCSRCRKRSGSAHAANIFLAPKNFTWRSGEENIGTYSLPNADSCSNWFCKTCGCRTPRVTEKGVTIPAGSLDQDPRTKPDQCIYWDSRAPWLPSYEALPKTPKSSL